MVTNEHLIPISFPHLDATEPFIPIPESKLSGTLKHSLMCFPITQDRSALTPLNMALFSLQWLTLWWTGLWISQGRAQGNPSCFPGWPWPMREMKTWNLEPRALGRSKHSHLVPYLFLWPPSHREGHLKLRCSDLLDVTYHRRSWDLDQSPSPSVFRNDWMVQYRRGTVQIKAASLAGIARDPPWLL